jgi:RNase P protein component
MENRINQGFDIIIVARNRALGKTQAQIQKDVEYAMRKLELIKD